MHKLYRTLAAEGLTFSASDNMPVTGTFVPPEFGGDLRVNGGSKTAPLPRVVAGGAPEHPLDSAGQRLIVPSELRDVEPNSMLVAFDIDGTILNRDGSISQAVLDSLRALDRAGAHVVIATGRSIPAVAGVLTLLQLRHGYVVCSNGAVTLRTGPGKTAGAISYEVVKTVTFPPAPIIDRLVEQIPDAYIGVEAVGSGFLVPKHFPAGELIGEQQVVGLSALREREVTRIILRAPSLSAEDLKRIVAGLGIDTVQWDIGWTAWLDVVSQSSTKATALAELTKVLGVDAAHTVAVGDGSNDVAMVDWAHWGLAMENGSEQTKAVAQAVLPPVTKNGAALVGKLLLR